MALTDITVRNSKPKDKQYKLSDSAGLYLLIKPNGNKYWRLKYRIAGKEKLLSIGAYPVVSLLEAREKCLEARKKLTNNIDPAQFKKEEKLKYLLNSQNTFESIAIEWHNNKKQKWTERHASRVLRRMKADIFPILGAIAINEIKPPELLAVLRIIENRGAIYIAHRALQTCGQIFRYAVSIGKVERDISADLRGALKTKKKKIILDLKQENYRNFLIN